MSKLFAILAMFFLVGVVAVNVAPLTSVSGVITDQDNQPVVGADVTISCMHNDTEYTRDVVSGADGMYYAFFPTFECDDGDEVTVTAELGEANGDNGGTVTYDGTCQINTSIVNIQIPEFGVIAAGVALIGAIAIFAIKRKN